MRKYILLSFLFAVSFQLSFGQTSPSEVLAQRIANTMRDTIALSPLQTQRVYIINMDLNARKMQARTTSTNTLIVGQAIQVVERTRDSLYSIELTTPQYELYLQKKRNIIKSN